MDNNLLIKFLDCLNAGTTVEHLLQQSSEFMVRAFRPEHVAFWVNGENASGIPASQPFLDISRTLHAHVKATNAFVLVVNPSRDVLTSHIKNSLSCQVAAFPVRLQGKHVATLVLGSHSPLSQVTESVSLLLEKLSVIRTPSILP